MLSVALVSNADPARLETTLRALVPATLDGQVCDVWVFCGEPAPIAALCDAMGAETVSPSDAQNALQRCRGEWLLVLEEGAWPRGDWVAVLAAHAASGGGAARFRTQEPVVPFWRRLFGRAGDPLRAGFLIPVDQARAALRNGSLATLPVGRAVRTLRADLEPASES